MTTKKSQPGDDEQPKRPRSTKPKAESASKPRSAKPKGEATEATSESAAKKSGSTPKAAGAKPKAESTVKPRSAKPKTEATETKPRGTKPRSSSPHHEREERVTEGPTREHTGRPASQSGTRNAQSRSTRRNPQTMPPSKMVIVAALVLTAFIGSYNYAAAKSGAKAGGVNGLSPNGGLVTAANPAGGAAAGGGGCCGGGGGGGAAAGGAATGGAAAGGGGCCGGGGGTPIEGKTTVEGGVQKIAVDTSKGSFNPNVIKAKAGVPLELSFSQAPGGCLSGVLLPDFGIQEDLTSGAKTIKLPALEKGEYSFYCQMQMVSAKIVVE